MAEKMNLAIGGQALIEGVMIRAPRHIVMSVRKPDGQIETKDEVYIPFSKRYKPLGLPILRGICNFAEMMVIGMRAINWSSLKAFAEPDDETEQGWIALTITILVSLVMVIVIFKYLPLLLTQYINDHVPLIKSNWLLFNLLDGLIKIAIFLLYIFVISRFKDIHRVFEYHGAEHKSIFAYEHDATLTPTSVRNYQKEHPRCGTSFILIVFTVSIIVYTLIPRSPEFLINLGIRVAMLPIIAGIAYELLKISGKYHDTWFGRMLTKPGMWFQYITTQEPDDKQLEVAIAALKRALALEGVKQA